MNRRIETALRSKYNFRRLSINHKEMNELFAQCYYIFILSFSQESEKWYKGKCYIKRSKNGCVRVY